MTRSRTLATTSYALLGLLAIKDWSVYELTQQAQRSFRHFFPRADSNLYETAKSLVNHGLVRARDESVGRRPRTVYSITPAGRRALKRWMEEPGRPPVIMWDTMVKVFFAESGTREGVVELLDQARLQVEEVQGQLAAIAEAYASGDVPFPGRVAQNALIFRLMWRQMEVLHDWAVSSALEVSQWPDVPREWPHDPLELQRIAKGRPESS